MLRSIVVLGAACWMIASGPAWSSTQYAQWGGPPPGPPPPCNAVTPSPLGGAARGAAAGAVFGGIAGNAGRGAAIGAAVGGVGRAAQRGSARASGACF